MSQLSKSLLLEAESVVQNEKHHLPMRVTQLPCIALLKLQ
jgi:hypothetical protein